jgi:O-succinylbenzoate synthase
VRVEEENMKIDKMDVYYVTLPLIYPWRTAYGEDAAIHSVLVRMVSGGQEGFGETTPFYAPTYSPETASSAFFLIKEIFGPFVVGKEWASASALRDALAIFKGNPFAKAGIEIAWWVLEAKLKKLPLHRLLGGKRNFVEAGQDFGIQDSIDMLLGNIEKAVREGFKRIKLKARPGWDLEMLRAVRASFPKTIFHIDCNSGYTLDHLPFFKEVDKLGLAMIEQPLFHDDLVEHAELQRQMETPICLDESVKSPRDMRLAIKLKSCRYVNIKPGRVGGLQNAIEIHNLARDNGIPAWVGGMLESGLGSGVNIELGTLDNFTYPGDLFPSERFYVEDLAEPAVRFAPGKLGFEPSSVPGIPYTPVVERIEKRTIMKATLKPA